MKKVFKYTINNNYVVMPKGYSILHVGVQNDTLFAWALIDPEETEHVRALRVIGTGHPIPDNVVAAFKKFWGTHVFCNDSLVFHVWAL